MPADIQEEEVLLKSVTDADPGRALSQAIFDLDEKIAAILNKDCVDIDLPDYTSLKTEFDDLGKTETVFEQARQEDLDKIAYRLKILYYFYLRKNAANQGIESEIKKFIDRELSSLNDLCQLLRREPANNPLLSYNIRTYNSFIINRIKQKAKDLEKLAQDATQKTALERLVEINQPEPLKVHPHHIKKHQPSLFKEMVKSPVTANIAFINYTAGIALGSVTAICILTGFAVFSAPFTLALIGFATGLIASALIFHATYLGANLLQDKIAPK